MPGRKNLAGVEPKNAVSMRTGANNMVYLIGAGPGDPGLLTLAAKEYLSMADAVVYDRLANGSILNFAPPDAEFIYVGKAAGNHAMPQEEINELLARLAKEKKCVVRLKGGDPFVFGRGGEEALRLKAENLPFVIVPGVTSAVAVPAYAGIPVTHRRVAASFAVVTGHEDPTKNESALNWAHLAKAVDTLVFLMGVKNLPLIAEQLIANGKDPDTPAALIRCGTRPDQETIVTTLAKAPFEQIKPPAVFVVGETVNLRQELRWFDTAARPLLGKKILVTRAREQASALSRQLSELGAEVCEYPVIKIAPPADDFAALDKAVGEIGIYKRIIFTSVNGVAGFFERLLAADKDARALSGAKIAVIGKATAEKLKSYGIVADTVPQEFCAEGLIDALKGEVVRGEKILLARAAEARDVLPKALTEMGALVTVAPVYRTLKTEENAQSLKRRLTDGEFSAVTFTSSSTVHNLAEMVGGEALKCCPAVVIGPVTAATLAEYGIPPAAQAAEYTIAGVVAAVKKILTEDVS